MVITPFLTFKGFSQTDTSKIVGLSEATARAVIFDLITGDKAKEQVSELMKVVEFSRQKSVVQDSIIVSLEKKVGNFEQIVGLKDQEIKAQENVIDSLEKNLRKQRTKLFFYRSGIVVGAAILVSTLLVF